MSITVYLDPPQIPGGEEIVYTIAEMVGFPSEITRFGQPSAIGRQVIINGNRADLNDLQALCELGLLLHPCHSHGELGAQVMKAALAINSRAHFETLLVYASEWKKRGKTEPELLRFLDAIREKIREWGVIKAVSDAEKDVFGENSRMVASLDQYDLCVSYDGR